MHRFSRRGFITATLAVAALSACSRDDQGSDSGKVSVFASTIVWGSIAQAVGGDHVQVFSAVSSPDQDPHDYEASAQDKLRMSQAKVAVLNGGGYDAWAKTLVESVESPPEVIDAFVLGKFRDGDNEHVFYDMHVAKQVAQQLATRLGAIDADHQQDYTDAAAAFTGKIDQVLDKAKKWATSNPNAKAVSTESVAEYLLDDLGITDVTPPEYIRQSESESGPSVAVVERTRQLIGTTATVLVVNGQTEDAVSQRLVERANQTGAKVVKVFETFPEGVSDYPTFMDQAISALTR